MLTSSFKCFNKRFLYISVCGLASRRSFHGRFYRWVVDAFSSPVQSLASTHSQIRIFLWFRSNFNTRESGHLWESCMSCHHQTLLTRRQSRGFLLITKSLSQKDSLFINQVHVYMISNDKLSFNGCRRLMSVCTHLLSLIAVILQRWLSLCVCWLLIR